LPEWLGTSPYAPLFEVIDTVKKYGRYAQETKTIPLKDLIKFHGNFRVGLVAEPFHFPPIPATFRPYPSRLIYCGVQPVWGEGSFAAPGPSTIIQIYT
jgi:hypothetical protein